MREASTLLSIIDDNAATGNVASLRALRKRWERRANTSTSANVALVWAHASDVAYNREVAMRRRLAGEVEIAMRYEAEAERCARAVSSYGTR
jgi:hypothetical protein